MSDHETGGMPSDEDLSLPKATVTKMIAGACAAAVVFQLVRPIVARPDSPLASRRTAPK